MTLPSIDMHLIHFFRRYYEYMARTALFVVYVWFGVLKMIGLSPAGPLVNNLLSHTMPFISPETFMICFGAFEVLIGVLFIIKGFERVVIPFLFLHLITTLLPLFILPQVAWVSPFVPTMEGQYIIKNLLVIACAMGIASHLHIIHRSTLSGFIGKMRHSD